MSSNLESAIKLAKKTGDSLIVFNSNNPIDSYVVLPLKNYEKLIEKIAVADQLDQELTEQINRDIALWKASAQKDENLIESFMEESQVNQSEDLNSDLIDDIDSQEETNKSRNHWQIPVNRKQRAAVEEDDQYLIEDLPF